jgi:hypothetical protein
VGLIGGDGSSKGGKVRSPLTKFFSKIYTMQLKILAIPALDPARAEEVINRFLMSYRVLWVDWAELHLVERPESALWAVCVRYLGPAGSESGGLGTAKELPSARDFAVFARLLDLRKELAEKEALSTYKFLTSSTTTRPGTRTTTMGSVLPELDPAAVLSGPSRTSAKTQAPPGGISPLVNAARAKTLGGAASFDINARDTSSSLEPSWLIHHEIQSTHQKVS